MSHPNASSQPQHCLSFLPSSCGLKRIPVPVAIEAAHGMDIGIQRLAHFESGVMLIDTKTRDFTVNVF